MRDTIRAASKSLILETLSITKAPIGRRRFRAAVRSSQACRLNIGAGLKPVEGWINTDIHWRSRYYLDLLKPWPVPRDKVTHVYADNVIEHFTLAQGRVLLGHAFDALVAGGTIRLATPDVGRTARAYLDQPDVTSQVLDRHRRHGYDVHYPVDLLRTTFAENGHWMGYCHDEASLTTELARAGFESIQRVECGESADPVFRGLERRTEEADVVTQLVVEAVRP